MIIESYAFGRMIIDGIEYRSDLSITRDHQVISWWRGSSHRLVLDDLRSVLDSDPEILIIGTGYYGLMKVDKTVKDHCKSKEIELLINRTSDAVDLFNSNSSRQPAAAFHLTC